MISSNLILALGDVIKRAPLVITIACAVVAAIAFLVGWIPTDKGLLPFLLAIFSMLLTAFIIAVLTYRRQKKLAERINRELEQRRS